MNQWHEMKIEVQSQNKKTRFKKYDYPKAISFANSMLAYKSSCKKGNNISIQAIFEVLHFLAL
jgi:hypothetical protein